MSYSKYFLAQDKKIPIPVTIVVVLLLILFISQLFASSPVPSRASKQTIKNLKIVNPSHNQIGLFWQTDDKATGWVVYGKNERNLDKVALDERDLEEKKNLFYYHLSFLKNLEPNTRYYYKIVNNNQLVEDKNSKVNSFITPVQLTPTYNLNPAYGKLIKENGVPVEGVLVVIIFNDAYPLIAQSKTTGEWLIPLNTILNKKSLQMQTVGLEDKLTIEVYGEDKKKTQIVADLKNVSPLPQTIIVGKNYKFIGNEEVLSASVKNKLTANKIDILFPKKAAIIPEGRPLVKGTAIPGNEVEVSFDSVKENTFKTVTDKEGVWRIALTQQLSQGSHLLTVVTKDSNNKVVRLNREFSIAKSGEQVLAVATAEATPTLLPTMTLTPIASPTVFITSYVTQFPTVTVSPPTSGTSIVPIGIASASLIILGFGILLAF